MRLALTILVVLVFLPTIGAAESVGVPWSEFKELYDEHIRNSLTKELKVKEPKAQYTLDSASYELSINEELATCNLTIKGRVVSGTPQSVPLLPLSTILSRVGKVSGGSLILEDEGGSYIGLRPNKEESFSASLTFLLTVEEDKRSKLVTLPPSLAITNGLSIKLPKGHGLIEQPGLKDGDSFRFPRGKEAVIRYSRGDSRPEVSLIEVDSCSFIRLQGRRSLMTTYFAPRRPVVGKITITPPKNAQYVSTSLKGSWLKRDGSKLFVTLPRKSEQSFWLQFSLSDSSFTLPTVSDNDGKEGFFIVEEPEDGQVSLSTSAAITRLPLTRLSKELQVQLPNLEEVKRIPPNESLTLTVKHFATVKTPPIVLDRVLFHTSFEENGSSLSLLTMVLPSTVGSRLVVGPVAGAEIWSLEVNGKRTKVYSQEGGGWVIPLARGKKSLVELAFLRKGDKLGLRGRLEAIVPPINLPSQDTHLSIGLPERVELVSVEGPVIARTKADEGLPAQFVGIPHYFSRNFDKGDGMTIALFYREPIDK